MLYFIEYTDADQKHPEKPLWMDELIGYSFYERGVAYCIKNTNFYQSGGYYYWNDVYSSSANVI